MGGPNSTGISRAPAYSGILHVQSSRLRLQDSHLLRSAFPIPFNWRVRFVTVRERLQLSPAKSYYPDVRNACRLTRTRFRLIPFRSPLLRESLRFLLYPATEMFHFADFAPTFVGLRPAPEGFPHSETFGSRVVCSSPKLFAAYRVLLR